MNFVTFEIRILIQIFSILLKATATRYLDLNEVAEKNVQVVATILQSVTNIGYFLCAMECEALSQCKGFNFHNSDLLCELVTGQMTKNHFRDGWYYTDLGNLKTKSEYFGKEDNTCSQMEKRIQLSSGATKCIKHVFPMDCQNPFLVNQASRIFKISPQNKKRFDVYCDLDASGGPWTVIQARVDSSVDFNRGWIDYKNGFGDLTGNFWLGNDNIHSLLSAGSYKLRVDMEYFDGEKIYAEYSTFYVGNEAEKYQLDVGGYSGNASDGMVHQNGMKFSAKDQDNDAKDDKHCAEYYTGGWWFKTCYECYLNGRYYDVSQLPDGVKLPSELEFTGIHWSVYRGDLYPLKKATMKVRK